MTLELSTAAPAPELAPALACAPPTRPRRAATALVLFIGHGGRPSAAQGESLASEGMRSLWLPGIEQVLAASRLARFDAAVLDGAILEGRDAATLSRLQAALQCPLLLLADHGDELDEIMALELGADAWLLRPVAPRRLRAHLAALMRVQRRVPPAEAPTLHDEAESDGWQLDRITNRLRQRARCVALTEVQAALLQCLLDADGRIVPRQRLLATLPLARATNARNVDVYVHRLRKRLLDAGAFELVIEAVRGRGYLLRPPA